MSCQTVARTGAVLGLAACLAAGTYGSHGNGIQNGFYATLTKIIGNSADEYYVPGAPTPPTWSYTGIGALDAQLRILVSFFAGFLHGESTWAVTLASRYLTLHFCAGWMLLSLEGLRNGNQDKLLAWTGVMGFLFQNAAYTVIVPLYLIYHLFSSPTSKPATASAMAISVDPLSARLLPLCVLIGFWVPTIMMALPSPQLVSAPAHYAWIAIWQLFPVWQSLAMAILRPLFSSSGTTGPSSRAAVSSLYKLVMAVCVASHLAVLAIALVPSVSSVVPAELAAKVPAWARDMLAETDFQSVFVPASLLNPPSFDPAAVKVVPANWLGPLAFHFLQWDVMSGNAAVLVWAGFMNCVGAKGGCSVGGVVKSAFWFVVGGPVAAAAWLLWERDEAVYEGEIRRGKKVL